MSKLSKTARASMIGQKEAKKDPFDTPEKKIKELRNQRRDGLAVNRYDFIDALIEAYDAALARIAQLEDAATDAAVERDLASLTWFDNYSWPPEPPKPEPDEYCVTLEDGTCVSEDPRCMHNQKESSDD